MNGYLTYESWFIFNVHGEHTEEYVSSWKKANHLMLVSLKKTGILKTIPRNC